MIKQVYWLNTEQTEIAWEDDEGLHSAPYPPGRFAEAIDEWVGQRGNVIAPYIAPVEERHQSDVQHAFFEVIAEKIKVGDLNLTLKEVVAQVDERIKKKR